MYRAVVRAVTGIVHLPGVALQVVEFTLGRVRFSGAPPEVRLRLLAAWQPTARGLRSFADFRRERMEPSIDDLASMQLHPTRPDVPGSSAWHANWRVRAVPGS